MLPNFISTSLIASYLYQSFLSLHFTCLFHSQSFQKLLPNLAASVEISQRCGECAIRHEWDVREEQHPCGVNK